MHKSALFPIALPQCRTNTYARCAVAAERLKINLTTSPESVTTTLAIALPSVLPKDSVYTTAVAIWANKEACKIVVGRLELDHPDVDVRIGVTDCGDPQATLSRSGDTSSGHQLERRAEKYSRMALLVVRDQVERLSTLPEAHGICRTLETGRIGAQDSVVEFRMSLAGLWAAQRSRLVERGWTVSPDSAEISLPPDAYEREVEWLAANRFIAG